MQLLSMSQFGMALDNNRKSHLGLQQSFHRQCKLAGTRVRQIRLQRGVHTQPKSMMSDGPAYNKYR